MGTWGYRPWESDEAADWFGALFASMSIDEKLDEAFKYSDQYEKMRAAAYILTALGHSSYLWPGDIDRLTEHIDKALGRLRNAIDPNSEDNIYGLWGKDPEIVEAFQQQIDALEALRQQQTDSL